MTIEIWKKAFTRNVIAHRSTDALSKIISDVFMEAANNGMDDELPVDELRKMMSDVFTNLPTMAT